MSPNQRYLPFRSDGLTELIVSWLSIAETDLPKAASTTARDVLEQSQAAVQDKLAQPASDHPAESRATEGTNENVVKGGQSAIVDGKAVDAPVGDARK